MIVRFIVKPLPNVPIIKEMVHNPNRIVAQLLGYRSHCHNVLRICNAPVVRDGHTKLHSVLPLQPDVVSHARCPCHSQVAGAGGMACLLYAKIFSIAMPAAAITWRTRHILVYFPAYLVTFLRGGIYAAD